MKKNIRNIVIVLLLQSVVVAAPLPGDIIFEKKVVVLVTNFDVKTKTIIFRENKKENSYIYRPMMLENKYYGENGKGKPIAKMPLNRKYHIRVGYYTKDDYEEDKGFIYYIGTVPYPF